jgi:hypothetical protein
MIVGPRFPALASRQRQPSISQSLTHDWQEFYGSSHITRLVEKEDFLAQTHAQAEITATLLRRRPYILPAHSPLSDMPVALPSLVLLFRRLIEIF